MSYQLRITDNGEVVATSGATPSTGKVADLVDLASMLNYLKQSYSSLTAEDTLVKQMIQSARRWIENYLGKSVIEKNIIAFTRDELCEFDLPMPPVSSILSVVRVDVRGTETTLTLNTDYYAVGVDESTLQFLTVWATTSAETAGVKVTYTAKMTDATELQICRQACMMIVAENYYNRGETGQDVQLIPFDVKRLLNPIRLRRTL